MILTSEKLKLNQIKKRVGDTWVLVYNPEYTEDNKFICGELIYFDKNKQKIYNFLKKDKSQNKNFAVLYMGKVPANEVYVLWVISHKLPNTTYIDGLLGLDFFRNKKLTVNFVKGEVELE